MDLNTSLRILDLELPTDPATARQAYTAKVRRWHPDQFPEGSSEKAEADERLKQINIAYARIREYLAFQPPRPEPATEPPPRPQPPSDTDTGRSERRRSWIDHLFDTLNAFAAEGQATPRAPQAEPPPGGRRRTFSQVLDEMGGGRPAACRKPRPASPAAGRCGYPAAPTRPQRRRYGIDAVEGIAPVEPVKPVGRVRGIGRRR